MPCCSGPQECHDFDPDREGIGDADLARFGGDSDDDDDPESRCPECGAAIYHDAALCHSCGFAVTDSRRATRSRRWVPLAAALATLGMLMGYLLLGW